MRSRRQFLNSAAVGSAALAAGAIWSPRAAEADAATSTPLTAQTPDVGFCHDMTAHHVQALVMCERILGRGTGDAVQAAAAEVLRNQAIEVGMMRAWLADWGQPTTEPETAMGWMGMNDGAGLPLAAMPGLATDDELRGLSLAEGMEQGQQWLTLMRAHHVGGVTMAEAAIELASYEKVRRLARIQAEVQTFEIGQYDQLLATEYL